MWQDLNSVHSASDKTQTKQEVSFKEDHMSYYKTMMTFYISIVSFSSIIKATHQSEDWFCAHLDMWESASTARIT